MNQWEEWQLQFDQDYDGAYRYLDRCGQYIALIRQRLEFMPASVNPMICDMEQPDLGLKLQESSEVFSLTCWQPSNADMFILVGEHASSIAMLIFRPFSVNLNRLTSRACLF